jgi:hypothetical protein
MCGFSAGRHRPVKTMKFRCSLVEGPVATPVGLTMPAIWQGYSVSREDGGRHPHRDQPLYVLSKLDYAVVISWI